MLIKFIILIGIIILRGFICRRSGDRREAPGFIMFLICTGYLAVLLAITLCGRAPLSSPSLIAVPLKSYQVILSVRWYGAGEYIALYSVGNVLLFIPPGMIVANIFGRKHSFWLAIFIGFALSLAIEITQYLSILGTFEVDDLIHNIWGTVIGYSVARLLKEKEKTARRKFFLCLPMLFYIALLFSVCIIPIMKDVSNLIIY